MPYIFTSIQHTEDHIKKTFNKSYHVDWLTLPRVIFVRWARPSSNGLTRTFANQTSVNQWKNTGEVLQWFGSINDDKHACMFILYYLYMCTDNYPFNYQSPVFQSRRKSNQYENVTAAKKMNVHLTENLSSILGCLQVSAPNHPNKVYIRPDWKRLSTIVRWE